MDLFGPLGKIVDSYLKLPLSHKIAIPTLIVGSAILLVLAIRWSQKPDFGVLFSDLDPADASAIVDYLKSKKIAYELTNDGRTVRVSPSALVHELRLTLAAMNLPRQGSFGFEILESNTIGASAFLEKVKFTRALQGELEKTIKSIEGVLSARVHIVKPERSLFKESPKATASVYLKLRPGLTLSPEQITGIANLVSGSVEGLTPQNVSIIDANGNLLSSASNLDSQKQLVDNKTRLETYYSKQIEDLLTRVLGPGKAVAKVAIELDHTEAIKEEEIYDPNMIAVRSEKSTSVGSSFQAGRGGVPGVVSNMPEASNLVTPESKEEESRNEIVKNFEVSKAVIRSQSTKGAIKRISVAVVVDGEYVPETSTDGSTITKFKPLSQERLNQLEQIVKQAIGFNPARGDTVSVESVPFYSPSPDLIKELEKSEMISLVLEFSKVISPIILLALLFFVVLKPLVKHVTAKSDQEVDISRLLPAGLEELEKELTQERKVTAKLPDVETAVDIEQLEQLLAENSKMVLENPNQAALLIRYWLNEGRL
ncbi:MAG: flagellar basal-body MS-ring/collar protein FliF [Deltaproteobacteria bacterium]|nr:flagellar basal-body MS-ring/collar protein FliF [Deltaproteobacteria bacterium]MCX7953143.1 flagellar basal-body MS-ring/collar protein FliF [Deltaproteobacteria bacterium]